MNSKSKQFSHKNELTKNKSGFSFLTVLLIVIGLSLFTTTLFIAVQPSISTSATDVTYRKADLLQTGLKKYKTNHAGTPPASLDNLVTPTSPACAADANTASPTYRQLQGWCGPYVDSAVSQNATDFKTDGWGILFQYDTLVLKSCGPDKTCGNTDDLTFNNF